MIGPDLKELEKEAAQLRSAIAACKARDWLLEYGPDAIGPLGVQIEVHQPVGSSVPGAIEGHTYLNAAARRLLGDIGKLAYELALADIEKRHKGEAE